MAVTSLWRVTSKYWTALAQVVDYVTNEKKTIERESESDQEAKSIESVIDYAMREGATKTDTQGESDNEDEIIVKRYVSGINCDPDNAVSEFQMVKNHYDKKDGTLAYHGYQSFAPGEATPEMAHEIGVKLANEIWGENYQVVVCTHLDKASHLHNHFVVNTVGYKDGIKYYRSESDYRAFRKTSDRLCQEYGLSTIDKQQGKRKDRTEWEAEKNGEPTWKDIIRKDVDSAISKVTSYRDLLAELQDIGYEIKDGKYLSVRPIGRERFFRLERQLGEEYSKDNIQKRILDQKHLPGEVQPDTTDDTASVTTDDKPSEEHVPADFSSVDIPSYEEFVSENPDVVFVTFDTIGSSESDAVSNIDVPVPEYTESGGIDEFFVAVDVSEEQLSNEEIVDEGQSVASDNTESFEVITPKTTVRVTASEKAPSVISEDPVVAVDIPKRDVLYSVDDIVDTHYESDLFTVESPDEDSEMTTNNDGDPVTTEQDTPLSNRLPPTPLDELFDNRARTNPYGLHQSQTYTSPPLPYYRYSSASSYYPRPYIPKLRLSKGITKRIIRTYLRSKGATVLVFHLPFIRPKRRVVGVQALYLRYMFLLGKLPKQEPRSRGPINRSLNNTRWDRELICKINDIQLKYRLLSTSHIQTNDDLVALLRLKRKALDTANIKKDEIRKEYSGDLTWSRREEMNRRIWAIDTDSLYDECWMLKKMIKEVGITSSETPIQPKHQTKEKEIRK